MTRPIGRVETAKGRSKATKNQGEKGYMQAWLQAAREHLRNTPHQPGQPSQAMLQSVASEIANRWGGANWNSGVGFRVSYSTLGQELFFDRKHVSRCFEYWEAQGFLKPAGVHRYDRGLVHIWDATLPNMRQGVASSSPNMRQETPPSSWDMTPKVRQETPGDATGCHTTLPSKEGEGASLPSPNPLREREELLLPITHGAWEADVVDDHSLDVVAATKALTPIDAGKRFDVKSTPTPLGPLHTWAEVVTDRVILGFEIEAKREIVFRFVASIANEAEEFRSTPFVFKCLEGRTRDDSVRKAHQPWCLFNNARVLAKALAHARGTEPKWFEDDEGNPTWRSHARYRALIEIMGWVEEDEERVGGAA